MTELTGRNPVWPRTRDTQTKARSLTEVSANCQREAYKVRSSWEEDSSSCWVGPERTGFPGESSPLKNRGKSRLTARCVAGQWQKPDRRGAKSDIPPWITDGHVKNTRKNVEHMETSPGQHSPQARALWAGCPHPARPWPRERNPRGEGTPAYNKPFTKAKKVTADQFRQSAKLYSTPSTDRLRDKFQGACRSHTATIWSAISRPPETSGRRRSVELALPGIHPLKNLISGQRSCVGRRLGSNCSLSPAYTVGGRSPCWGRTIFFARGFRRATNASLGS